IEPLGRALEAGAPGESERVVPVVLAGALGPDALPGAERRLDPEAVDHDRLVAARDEVHLDAALGGVPPRLVLEEAEVEVRTQVAVDPREQVEIEGGRDAGRIV